MRSGSRWTASSWRLENGQALARVDGLIRPASELAVTAAEGCVRLLIDKAEAARLFVAEDRVALVEAQWRSAALNFVPTGKGDAKRLLDKLRRVAVDADPALAGQIIERGRRLAELDRVLREDEAELHELTCRLFGLTPEERRLVEAGR